MKLSSQEKLQEYSDQIEIILSVISAPLWGILKYYERVCEDFFGKISKVTQQDIDIFLNKLENITSDLHDIENELYKLSHNQKNLVNFYLNNIQLSLKKINLFKKAAYIEAQKWGFKISHNKIKKLLLRNYILSKLWNSSYYLPSLFAYQSHNLQKSPRKFMAIGQKSTKESHIMVFYLQKTIDI